MALAPNIQPVILAGGSGTRLWPLSRQHYPKQLLALIGEQTMLQQAIQRAAAAAPGVPPLVITGDETRFLVAEQARELGEPVDILLEPIARNTAPAIALAAFRADPTDILLVMAADHLIGDTSLFVADTEVGARSAQAGQLVTFGVKPTFPATGYGYIETGTTVVDGAVDVVRFTEKPDPEAARQFVEDGGYLWNSGMFMFRADVYLAELLRFAPKIHECVARAAANFATDLDFERVSAASFGQSPSVSVDYAIMELTNLAVTVPLSTTWNDIGSFGSLWEIMPKDEHENALRGDIVTVDTTDSLIIARDRLVTTLGVQDLIVIEDADVVLVANRSRAEDIKILVEKLGRDDRTELVTHRRVYRPWGYYERLDSGAGFQVKRLFVNPHNALSLQSHQHRAEHWIVVQGTATITRGDSSQELLANESTFIPRQTRHRLANNTPDPLEVIEVQSGDYLGEDDIERFDDDYGRN